MNHRRGIIGLAFFSCAFLGTVALYQIGIIKKLPQPPSRAFNSRRVHRSSQAYAILETPDAFLGLASYAVTACLAAMGPENRAPWMSIAMALKLLADSAMAFKLTLDEATKLRAFSIWSILTAAATWTALPLALPETLTVISAKLSKHHAG